MSWIRTKQIKNFDRKGKIDIRPKVERCSFGDCINPSVMKVSTVWENKEVLVPVCSQHQNI